MTIEKAVHRTAELLRARGHEGDVGRAELLEQMLGSGEVGATDAGFFAVGFLEGVGEISREEANQMVDTLGGW